MGVRGLTGFIARQAELYLLPYELHDCNLVIDGDSLSCNIYNDVSGITSTFGGDYDVFYRAVVNFFQVLAECNIEPYVLMDGGYESRKLNTVGKRLRGKISVIKRVNPCDTRTVFPVLMKEVFVDAVRDCGVAVMRCAFEADDELATLSRKLGCPVLTYDSDFYIYNVQYIPLITLTIKAHTKKLVEMDETNEDHLVGRNMRKNEAKHVEKLTKSNRIVSTIKVNNVEKNAPKKGKTYKFLDCCIYRIEHLIEQRSLSKEKLPLFAALLGNDYIARSRFRNLFAVGMGKVGRSRKVQRQQKRIQVIIRWLREQTVQSAMRQILSRLRKAQRKSLKNQMYAAIHGYSNEKCRSYDFFVTKYESAFKRYPSKKLEDVEKYDADETYSEGDYMLEEEEEIEGEDGENIEGEDSGEVSESEEEGSLEDEEINDEEESNGENADVDPEAEAEAVQDFDGLSDEGGSEDDDESDDNDDNGRAKTSRFPTWFLEKLYAVHLPRYFVNLVYLRKYINSPQIEHFPYSDCNEIALPILIYAFTLLHIGIQNDEEDSEELALQGSPQCGNDLHICLGKDGPQQQQLTNGAEKVIKEVQIPGSDLPIVAEDQTQVPPAGDSKYSNDAEPIPGKNGSHQQQTESTRTAEISNIGESKNSEESHLSPENYCVPQAQADLSAAGNSQYQSNPESIFVNGRRHQSAGLNLARPTEFTYMARRPRVTNIWYTRYGIDLTVKDKFNPTQPDPSQFEYVFRHQLPHLDADKLFKEVQRLPRDLRMYFLAIVYWLHKSQHCDIIHLHALLISLVVLRTIDSKIPVERDERTFQKRFGKILKKERTVRDTEAQQGKTRAIRADLLAQPLPERMSFVPKSDCYLVMETLLKHFHMQEIFKKKFDDFSTIVLHAFAEFQSIVYQLYGLNGLLDMPYQPTKMGELYCGVFIYNMYDVLKTRPDVKYYVRNFIFRDSQMMYDFYVYLWEWCEEFTPHWKRPSATAFSQVLNKKSLKKKRQAARKKAAGLNNVDPNAELVDRSDGEGSATVENQQFFDLNNKFCEFLTVRGELSKILPSFTCICCISGWWWLTAFVFISILVLAAERNWLRLHPDELYRLSPRAYYLRLQCIAKIDRFIEFYTNVSHQMDSVFEAYLGPDGVLAGAVAGAVGEPDDIPKVNTTVWVLGKRYNAIQELDLIRRDIQSRLWCTYRRGFVPLGAPQLTTDKGWGCMLRCGQMVLAQALIDLHLGREWFWTSETRDATYLKIVNRFEDSRKSFFSIHQIALMGDSEDKKVGQWFGPNTVAQVLKKLVRYDDWCSIVVHVAMDNTIVTDDIYSLCLENPNNDDTWKPLLLIIPLRLGLSDINPIYIPALKNCFELVGSCGMIGGRPNQALYFVGYVDDEVLYLDPHTTQRCGSVGQKTSQDEIDFDATFHQRYAGRISFQQMDPSMAMCFLCKSRLSFEVLLDSLRTKVLAACTQPLLEIAKTRSQEWVSSTAGMASHFTVLTSIDGLLNLKTPSTATTTASCAASSDATNSNTPRTTIAKTIATSARATAGATGAVASAIENYKNPYKNRTISFCDSEDFENVNHINATGLTSNGCDGDVEPDSDDEFEIIS